MALGIKAEDMQKVASIIREARKEKDLTVREVAKKAGISSTLLTRIELCERVPSPYAILSISEVLGLPTDEMLKLTYPQLKSIKGIKDLFPIIKSDEDAKQIEELIPLLAVSNFTTKEFELLKRIINCMIENK